MDAAGVLRVGGRIGKSDLPYAVKHPMLLPKGNHFTTLLIDDAHRRTLHGGAQLTLCHLREQYWVIDGRNQVRNFVGRCVACRRYRARAQSQIMGELPAERLRPSRPFLHTGVDYAGPIDIRMSKGRGNRSYKAYISVFICFSTRAAHLELVSDYSAQAFVAAYRRFVGRRGRC